MFASAAAARALASTTGSSISSWPKTLAAAWETGTVEERSTLLDYWVLEVLMVVEPIPGMKRANVKTALVWLRSDPEIPRRLELGQRCASADLTSARTEASVSDAEAARSASSAPGEPIRPAPRRRVAALAARGRPRPL